MMNKPLDIIAFVRAAVAEDIHPVFAHGPDDSEIRSNHYKKTRC